MSPVLADGFFSTEPPGKPLIVNSVIFFGLFLCQLCLIAPGHFRKKKKQKIQAT